MRTRNRVLLGAAALSLLSACAGVRPLPVREPNQLLGASPALGGLNPPRTIDLALDTLRTYGSFYYGQAEELYASNYTASDTTFAGGVLGMIGGLAKSQPTALAGAVLGGAGTTSSERYRFVVQAHNYEQAGDAMFCLHRALLEDPADELLREVNARIDEVRFKLRGKQAKVDLATPNLDAIKAAIEQEMKAKKEQEGAEQARDQARDAFNAAQANAAAQVRKKGVGVKSLQATAALVDAAAAHVDQAERLLEQATHEHTVAELKKCSAAL